MAILSTIEAITKAVQACKQYIDKRLGNLVIVQLTEAEYAALAVKDENTLYIVTD